MTVFLSRMSPEKLFDYLEGNLPAAERAQLEAQLETDPQLQRELAIARVMHERSRGSREVLGESEDLEIPSDAGAKLGRRVATAFAALVLLNVIVGILFIAGKKQRVKSDDHARELALHEQVESSLKSVAERTMPPPTLGGDEIRLFAPVKEHDSLANNVVLLASQSGGSAAKAPSDESGTTVLAQIPSERAEEFRRAIAPLAQTDPPSPTPTNEKPAASGAKKNIYVRITEAPRSPNP
jgi:hypothetical protein